MYNTFLLTWLIGLLLVNAQTTINSEEFFMEDELDKFEDEKTRNKSSSGVYQTVQTIHVVIETHKNKNNGVVLVHISDPLIIIKIADHLSIQYIL